MNSDLRYNNLILPLEMKLLLLCTLKNITGDKQKEIQELLFLPIDWETFLKLAVKNRVYPIVYRNLKEISAGRIKKQLLTKLKTLCKENSFDALLHVRELIRIIDLLKTNEIKAIPIKGTVLSMSIYQEVSIRASRDIDILAEPSRLGIINQLLLEEGYKRNDDLPQLTAKQRKTCRKTSYHWSYINNAGVQLELHWALSNVYYNISFKEMWNRKTEVIMFGRSFPLLCEEDNLLYLIAHGSRHAWKRLQWLCDIYETIRSKKLNWDYIVIRSKQLNIMHLLGQTMILLNVLFNFHTPAHPNLSKKDRELSKRLAIMALPFIISTDNAAECFGHHLYLQCKKYLFVWNRGIYNKMHYVAIHFMPNTKDYQTIKLSDQLFFLYYIVHLIRGLKKKIFSSN